MSSRSRRKALRNSSGSVPDNVSSNVQGQAETVIRAASITEILGTLPVLFGFHPQESLVVVALEGPRQRAGFRMRMDLPPPGEQDTLACYVADVLRHMGTRVVLLVAYAADPALADPLMEVCRDRLALDGVSIVEAVRSDGNRYWSYQCQDSACCPVEGTPFDAAASAGMALAVAEGVEVLPDRDALAARLAAPDGETRERMEDAVAAAAAQMTSIAETMGAAEQTRMLAEVGVALIKPILLRALSDPGAVLSDSDVADVCVWCSLVGVRDVAWAQMTRDNASASFAVWSQLARRTVPPFEPAVLALAGFAAWIKGDGAAAVCAVERAEAAAADYSMTRLLRETLAGLVPPSVWRRPDEAEVWAVLDR